MSFENQTVMLTGATGHLGQAVAAAFAAQGARLVLLARTQEALHRTFGTADPNRLLLAADLLDPPQIAAAQAQAVARYGRIHVLCNLAGGFRMGEAVHTTSDSNWDFLFDTNTRTLRNTVRSVVPHMLAQGGGKIVNVGAWATQQGLAQMGAYSASKSGVIRLTEAMAAELREQHIHVNCVLPSILDTPENRAAMPEADPARWVVPQDLAQVILFLASDAARAMHGAAVPVCGWV
jgi:NAD(P)-dependent dehydrogenase (short-subunit alcohol dehydrogenase family)